MIENNLEEKVMMEIKSGRVKLRSKYIFLAEKLGLGSAFVLSVLLAVLFFSLLLYYLRASDNLIYLSFGSRGFFAFLESFPYLLIIGLIFLIFLAGFLLKKNDSLYHKPFGILAMALVGVVLLGGSALTFTSIMERIEKRAFGPHPAGMVFKPFLHGSAEEKENGIAGVVAEVRGSMVLLQTPFGPKVVDLQIAKSRNFDSLQTGFFMVAIGERKGETFVAYEFKLFSKDEMPMIRNGVDRRFREPLK